MEGALIELSFEETDADDCINENGQHGYDEAVQNCGKCTKERSDGQFDSLVAADNSKWPQSPESTQHLQTLQRIVGLVDIIIVAFIIMKDVNNTRQAYEEIDLVRAMLNVGLASFQRSVVEAECNDPDQRL